MLKISTFNCGFLESNSWFWKHAACAATFLKFLFYLKLLTNFRNCAQFLSLYSLNHNNYGTWQPSYFLVFVSYAINLLNVMSQLEFQLNPISLLSVWSEWSILTLFYRYSRPLHHHFKQVKVHQSVLNKMLCPKVCHQQWKER